MDFKDEPDAKYAHFGWTQNTVKLEAEPGKVLWREPGGLPAPRFDGITAELRFDPKVKVDGGGLALDHSPGRAVVVRPSEGIIFLGHRDSPRGEWIREGSAPCDMKEQYQLTVLLDAGDIVVFLDGEQKFRVRARIVNIYWPGMVALGGTVTFDRAQLRKLE
jgi:hypothetical protein